MDIFDWTKIRALNGSQANGFEEQGLTRSISIKQMHRHRATTKDITATRERVAAQRFAIFSAKWVIDQPTTT